MKRSRKIIGIICLILLLLSGITFSYIHSEEKYRLEVIPAEGGGYGYKIYEKKRVIIVQPFIPVVSGKKTFQSEEDACCIGSLVLERIKAGTDFAISKADLEHAGIAYP